MGDAKGLPTAIRAYVWCEVPQTGRVAFVVLFVCAGNVCRSPTAELIFNTVTRSDLTRSISSGLHALPGEPIYGPTAAALQERGIDASGHRARLFMPGMAERADLVLTAERAQRDRVMADAPRAFQRTFTLKEFLDCARPAPGQVGALLDIPRIVSLAACRRSRRGPVPLDQDEVRDAYGQSGAVARAVAAEIETLVVTLSRVLLVGRPSPRPRAQLPTSRPGPHPPPAPSAPPARTRGGRRPSPSHPPAPGADRPRPRPYALFRVANSSPARPRPLPQ